VIVQGPPGSDPNPGITGGRLQVGDVGTVTTPITKPKALGPETSWSYFHPGRADARYAPAPFRAEVHAIDPQLDVVWHPVHERWCVWVRNPRITHWICAGWQMLFPVRYPNGDYLPLDSRVLATIYDRSPRKWGNARHYFDRIQDEVRRDQDAAQRQRGEYVGQIARDHYRHCQISVGYGSSNGSKFSQHHAGG
jgi:hypothetical protein